MPVRSARTSRALGRPTPPPMTVERPEIHLRYLSGAPYAPALRWRHGGFMFGPSHGNVSVPLAEVVWAADNGCFTQGDAFSVERWLAYLDRWRFARSTCLFAVLPDVPFDHDATVARSLPHVAAVRALGYIPALAIQEGATTRTVPWESGIGAVFIAGGKPLPTPTPLWGDILDIPQERAKATRAFKTSATAWAICREARRRGLHVHVARCNSKRSVQAAYDMGAQTVDGTMLAFAPDQNARRMERWFERLCAHPDDRRALVAGGDPRFSVCRQCRREGWVA